MLSRIAYLLSIIAFGFTSFCCNKKDNTGATPVVPVVNIEDASQERATSSSVMHFKIDLNKTTVPVSMDYTLKDGTATSPKDYTMVSGTVSIPAGQTNADIAVEIKGDPINTRQNNLQFTLQLSNPKNCTVGNTTATGTIITENGTNFITDTSGYHAPASYPGYTLAWSDEFSGTGLDGNVWNYENGNNNGWGNNELEYYTSSTKNVFVSNGNLIIEARKESLSGFNYTSARITTQSKKSFTYGRIDIRAKLPKGRGIWPALWMLGSNVGSAGWPACGEMDIMELLGQEPSKVYGTLHYGASFATHGSKGNFYTLNGSFYDQFHVFSMEWKQDSVKLFVDNNAFLTVSKADVSPSPYPFNAPFFFIFNVAVGGSWPGSPDATTAFPQRMIVDYVRVYQ